MGEAYDFPIDVWSYGIVLFEILVGGLAGSKPYDNLPEEEVSQ